MKPKHQRLAWIIAGMLCLGIGTEIAMDAFRENLVFFRTPSELKALHPASSEKLRIGGLVTQGSLTRAADGAIRFEVTDMKQTVPVVYRGEVPALFREGQGVVADGSLRENGVFAATRLLAKHDEKYMPPEVARALKDAGHPEGKKQP